MKELKGGGASDSDSGQASEEDDEEDAKRGQRAASNAVKEKTVKRQVNGTSHPGIQTLDRRSSSDNNVFFFKCFLR